MDVASRAHGTSGEYGGLFGVPGPEYLLEAQDCKAALPTQAHASGDHAHRFRPRRGVVRPNTSLKP
jgi:hypothetical protein